jgi:hypothetical protein
VNDSASVDARRAEQRRHQIYVGRRRIHGARRRRPFADPGDDERHPGGLVVEVVPLLVQPAVGAEQLAVIRGADQHGVLGAAVGDRAAHPVQRHVDLGVQPVVQVAVLLGLALIGAADRGRRTVPRVVRLPVGDLRGRFVPQILVGGGCGRDVRRVERRRRDGAAA